MPGDPLEEWQNWQSGTIFLEWQMLRAACINNHSQSLPPPPPPPLPCWAFLETGKAGSGKPCTKKRKFGYCPFHPLSLLWGCSSHSVSTGKGQEKLRDISLDIKGHRRTMNNHLPFIFLFVRNINPYYFQHCGQTFSYLLTEAMLIDLKGKERSVGPTGLVKDHPSE